MQATSNFITIKDAAFLVNKSSQTIRRLIKSNKIKFKRKKTPQGFNYSVDQASLLQYFDPTPRVLGTAVTPDKTTRSSDESIFKARIKPSARINTTTQDESNEDTIEVSSPQSITNQTREHAGLTSDIEKALELQNQQLEKFAVTLKSLINQHSQEKKQLFGLINNYQKRITSLEQQVLQLQAPSKKWYQFWK